MDLIFQRRKPPEPPMHTYQLLDAWKEQQRRYAGATNSHQKEEAIASAQTLFDHFIEGRKSSRPQKPGKPEKELQEQKLETLAKKILANSPHRYGPDSPRVDFYRTAIPGIRKYIDAEFETRTQASLQVERAEEAAAKILEGANAEATRIRDSGKEAWAQSARELHKTKAEKDNLEHDIEQLRASIDTLVIRRKEFLDTSGDTLVLCAGGCEFTVPLQAVERSDFFFPPVQTSLSIGPNLRYSVPDVTAEQLQIIAYFFRNDSLPSMEKTSLVSRSMLREVIERHGPSSMLTCMDDPTRYMTLSHFGARIDRAISKEAGIYLIVPKSLPSQDRSFSMRQSPLTLDEFDRVRFAKPELFKSAYNPSNIFLQFLNYCNGLSFMEGLEPVYKSRLGCNNAEVSVNFSANGFRLPCADEWLYALDRGEIGLSGAVLRAARVDDRGCNQWGFLSVNASFQDFSTRKTAVDLRQSGRQSTLLNGRPIVPLGAPLSSQDSIYAAQGMNFSKFSFRPLRWVAE